MKRTEEPTIKSPTAMLSDNNPDATCTRISRIYVPDMYVYLRCIYIVIHTSVSRLVTTELLSR